jgi:hypothetical protein
MFKRWVRLCPGAPGRRPGRRGGVLASSDAGGALAGPVGVSPEVASRSGTAAVSGVSGSDAGTSPVSRRSHGGRELGGRELFDGF